MINSKEYIKLLQVSHEILVKFETQDEEFYKLLDQMRKQFGIIKKEFDNYSLYPRYNTDKLEEAIMIIDEFCLDSGITIFWAFPANGVVFNEKNWFDISKIKQIAQFHYKNVNITKLIEI